MSERIFSQQRNEIKLINDQRGNLLVIYFVDNYISNGTAFNLICELINPILRLVSNKIIYIMPYGITGAICESQVHSSCRTECITFLRKIKS